MQRSSFETAQRYLDGISQHLRLTTTYDAPLILIGNKVDLERYRCDDDTQFNGFPFIEPTHRFPDK